jgi:hypothetical protein
LEEFFDEFRDYFEEEDLVEFMKELKYLERGSDSINIQELASMIKDDVEFFPR